MDALDADGDGSDSDCIASITATNSNEDVNENLILDAGEDTSLDGALTPGNSTGGTLPSSVVTNANGVATFNLNYLKNYATWIRVRVKATAQVQGTEATSQVIFRLPVTKEDADACLVINSPFGP